jgi:hypothetical protein
MFFHLDVRFSAPKTPFSHRFELKLKEMVRTRTISFNFSDLRFLEQQISKIKFGMCHVLVIDIIDNLHGSASPAINPQILPQARQILKIQGSVSKAWLYK